MAEEAKRTKESDFVGGSVVAFARAKKEGWTVVLPQPNELFVDIDDEAGFERFMEFQEILGQNWGVVGVRDTQSKSGNPNRKHIVVTLGCDVDPITRIALQACLGSDRKREILSLVNIKSGDTNPTLFFEKEKK